MAVATLEHVNITVGDPAKTAQRLCDLFDWHIRWQGDAIHGGHTIHVGADNNYIAVYSQDGLSDKQDNNYTTKGGLNHIGVVVDNLDDTERRIVDAGYQTHSHADYEPGRRFYFHDNDGIEFEVVSYTSD